LHAEVPGNRTRQTPVEYAPWVHAEEIFAEPPSIESQRPMAWVAIHGFVTFIAVCAMSLGLMKLVCAARRKSRSPPNSSLQKSFYPGMAGPMLV